jgi:uncharacterized membrane protein YhhN
MKKNLIILFTLLSCVYLTSLAFPPTALSWLLKIAPICVLFWVVLKTGHSELKPYLLVALVFSAAGDILLEFNLFIVGLAAFLLAQLTYASVFVRFWQGLQTRWPASLLLIGYIFGMAYLLVPTLGDLQIPVIAYLIAISFMGLLAIHSSVHFLWAVLGALVFISSDSLIAIDKFIRPIPLRSYWIMITYYAAQVMIIHGLLELRRPNREG